MIVWLALWTDDPLSLFACSSSCQVEGHKLRARVAKIDEAQVALQIKLKSLAAATVEVRVANKVTNVQT